MNNLIYNIREKRKESGKNYGVVFGLVAIIFAILVIFTLVTLISRIGKTKVTIKYAPFIAEVKIDGKRVKNNADTYLAKGTYKIEVSLEHFESIEKELVVEDEETYSIGELMPTDDEGEKNMKQRNSDYNNVEQLGAKVTIEAGEKRIEKDPIIQYLPYNTKGYSIGYVWEGEELVVSISTKSETYYGTIIYNLYNFSEKIKPAEYQIKIKNYNDIFGSITENDSTDLNNYLAIGFGEKFNGYKVYKTIENNNYLGLIISRDGLTNNSSSDNEEGVVYRMIVEKQGNGFKTITNPYPIVSRYNVKDLSIEFIDKINKAFPFNNL